MAIIKQIQWKFLLGVFKIKRLVSHWYGVRKLDYAKKDIYITTQTLREYYTRANSVKKEPETVNWLESCGEKKSVFYDIGANIGAYSLIAGSLGIEVYAFEPSYKNIETLQDNIFLNKLNRNITPLPFVLGVGNIIQSFSLDDNSSGATHTFSEFQRKKDACTQQLLVMSLDECVRIFNIPIPTMIKIDVDGAEINVLNGAKNTLAHKNLKHLLIEIEDEKKKEIFEIVKKYSFNVVNEFELGNGVKNYIFERA